jgi:hypothetical protein
LYVRILQQPDNRTNDKEALAACCLKHLTNPLQPFFCLLCSWALT